MIEIKEANPMHKIPCDECREPEEMATIRVLVRVGEINLCKRHYDGLATLIANFTVGNIYAE
ncbi:MAG: hypothetical protein WAU89_23500 [Candidatus Acidiferrales bacterium]